MADGEVESSEQNSGPGNSTVTKGPLKTAVSVKAVKSQKVPRTTKANKAASQIPVANNGFPVGSSLTPAGPCRHDNSLGMLTKKFINLIKHAEDGILDLNKAAGTLEEEVEKLKIEESRLDERIREMQETLKGLCEDENNQMWLFVTEEDFKSLPCFQAVDYSQRRYQIIFRSTMGRIDVYLVSKFEENFEVINMVEAQPSIPETLAANENASAHENRGNENDVQRMEAQKMCSDTSTSQDFVSGIKKIVPDVDSVAVYWLSSDTGISITDLWRTESEIDGDSLMALQEECHAIASISTPQAQTPSPITNAMPSAADPTGSRTESDK